MDIFGAHFSFGDCTKIIFVEQNGALLELDGVLKWRFGGWWCKLTLLLAVESNLSLRGETTRRKKTLGMDQGVRARSGAGREVHNGEEG